MNLAFLVLLFLSVVIVSSAIGILIMVFGWYVIALLGGAAVLFVLASLLRDWLVERASSVSR